MFLINSRQIDVRWHLTNCEVTHLPKLRVVFLPSSLRILLSIALVFSTNPPVSVCGTANYDSSYEFFLANWNVYNLPPHGGIYIVAQINALVDFLDRTALQLIPQSIRGYNIPVRLSLTLKRIIKNSWILTTCPSATPVNWPHLRYRLTRRGRTLRRKPWVFGGRDSHPSGALLMPAFSLPYAPTNLTVHLHCIWNAPLPLDTK